MKVPLLILRSRHQPPTHPERGITMILVALTLVAMIAMAAISIDVVTLYLAREEAQRSADAAAIAGARVLSLSGVTGDPINASAAWQSVCGGPSSPTSLAASYVASAVAKQNTIGAVAATTVTVTYSAAGTSSADCSNLPSSSTGVNNPIVTVLVSRGSLPAFFSRIWGGTGSTVTATASAEAFNPSNSGNYGNRGATGTITAVQPRCVKPWIVPNQDPLHPQPSNPLNAATYCTGTAPGCNHLVDRVDGHIVNPGVSTTGSGATGVIGEQFWLEPDCKHTGATCRLRTDNSSPTPLPLNPPIANNTFFPYPAFMEIPPTLQFLPGTAPTTAPLAVPTAASGRPYEEAVAGCDTSTVYQCGVQSSASANPNSVDLIENPGWGTGDVVNGVKALINEADEDSFPPTPTGQDTISLSAYPFRILAGSSNPIIGGALAGTVISSSNSVVSLPIYDSDAIYPPNANPGQVNGTGATSVTIIGFLQVFIKGVDTWGNMQVIVLNVVGCGNGTNAVGGSVTGSSPVPVRLITNP